MHGSGGSLRIAAPSGAGRVLETTKSPWAPAQEEFFCAEEQPAKKEKGAPCSIWAERTALVALAIHLPAALVRTCL